MVVNNFKITKLAILIKYQYYFNVVVLQILAKPKKPTCFRKLAFKAMLKTAFN